MRLAALALALAACSPAKDEPTTAATTENPDTTGTATLGMSSNPAPTTTAASTMNDTAGTTTDDTDPTAPTAPASSSDSGVTPDLPPAPSDSGGRYLFAVSTVIDPSKPFQFLALVDATDASSWTLELQPLTLGQGLVTSPRQPIGDPLVFADIPVDMAGAFTLDLGTVILAGATNPITGSDVTAELQLSGTVIDGNFFCGTVTGQVTSPLMTSIDGSTFAAARVPDPDILPTDVAVDCAMNTFTDP